jgi:hypothetical protein
MKVINIILGISFLPASHRTGIPRAAIAGLKAISSIPELAAIAVAMRIIAGI